MAYVKNSTILASDLNTFLAQTRAIYGVGSGDSGYGQTAITQPDVAVGDIIRGTHWANMRNMLAVCLNHQAGSLPVTLPPANLLAVPETIFAHETDAPSSNAYDVNGHITTATAQRLIAGPTSMTVTNNAHTVTRSTNWNANISTTVDVGFGSEDAARYFFNSGGQIRLVMANPNGSSSQDVSWRNVLASQIGTFTLSAHSSANSGTTNYSSSSVGFYEIATTATTVLSALNVGGGAYAANDVIITAQVLNRTGTRGGNGNTIRFVITLRDEHANAFYDSVSSGTNVVFSHSRATLHLTGIAVPTFATITNF